MHAPPGLPGSVAGVAASGSRAAISAGLSGSAGAVSNRDATDASVRPLQGSAGMQRPEAICQGLPPRGSLPCRLLFKPSNGGTMKHRTSSASSPGFSPSRQLLVVGCGRQRRHQTSTPTSSPEDAVQTFYRHVQGRGRSRCLRDALHRLAGHRRRRRRQLRGGFRRSRRGRSGQRPRRTRDRRGTRSMATRRRSPVTADGQKSTSRSSTRTAAGRSTSQRAPRPAAVRQLRSVDGRDNAWLQALAA